MADEKGTLTLGQLQSIFAEALAGDAATVMPMRGFRFMPSETPQLFRLFFRTSCHCGAAALLTLEVAKDMGLEQVKAALPALLTRLHEQVERFQAMPCTQHAQFTRASRG